MPIDPDRAVGAELPDERFDWSASDVLLYHLAVGAGSRAGDATSPTALRWTLDDDRLQVLPSFGVVASHFHDTAPPSLDLPGCDISLAQVLHGHQEVTLRAPLPTSARGTVHTRISDVWDKGKAAIIVREGRGVSDDGAELFTTRSSIFVRGEGGWGGDRGPSSSVDLPDREPEATSVYETSPQQALLYRLCGDRNPLHSDPAFAAAAGFPAPILHGLCSYGIVLREVVDSALDGDSARVTGFTARFAGVVFPGEAIEVRTWLEDGRAVVSATIADEGERAGAPVLSDCVVQLS